MATGKLTITCGLYCISIGNHCSSMTLGTTTLGYLYSLHKILNLWTVQLEWFLFLFFFCHNSVHTCLFLGSILETSSRILFLSLLPAFPHLHFPGRGNNYSTPLFPVLLTQPSDQREANWGRGVIFCIFKYFKYKNHNLQDSADALTPLPRLGSVPLIL